MKSNFVQNKFISGELSEVIKGRTDLDQYYTGMQTAENVLTVPQGGVKRRMGCEFIDYPQGPTIGITGQQDNTVPNLDATINGNVVGNLSDDDSDSPTFVQTTTINANPFVIFEFNFGIVQNYRYIDLLNISCLNASADGETGFKIQYTTVAGSSTWIDLVDVPKLYSYAQTFRLSFDVNAYKLRLVSTNITSGSHAIKIQKATAQKKSNANFDKVLKLHKFEVSREDAFLLAFTSDNLRVYRVTDTATTFLQDIDHGMGTNLPKRVAANENVLLLFNENEPPRRMVYNYNGNGLFWFDTPTFLNVPTFFFDDKDSPDRVTAVQTLNFDSSFTAGDRFQIEVHGVISKEMTYAGDDTVAEQNATAEHIRINLQDMPVFGDDGISVTRTGNEAYEITMAGNSANDYELLNGFILGDTNKDITFDNHTIDNEGKATVWSATRGYPRMGVFANGRLFLGGTKSKPQSLFASRAGSFLDFLVDEGNDDEGMFLTMHGQKRKIFDVTGGRGVNVFTGGAEFRVLGNVPTEMDIVEQTQHGSFSEDVSTVAIDGATLFVDKNGHSLRQFVFSFQEDGFVSHDLTVLASDIINDPVDIAVMQNKTSDDADFIFIINKDGSAAVLNTLRDQDIIGFTRHNQVHGSVTDKHKHCVAVNDILHTITEIDDDLDNKDFVISRHSFDCRMDHAVRYDSASTTLDGLDHLEGRTVQITVGGDVLSERAVSSGSITLTSNEAAKLGKVEVGLNFLVKIKTMPISTATSERPDNALYRKRIDRMQLRVIESSGVNIDGVAVLVREFVNNTNSSIIPLTGIIEDRHGGKGYDTEVAPEITVPDPTPFYLQMIEYEISS